MALQSLCCSFLSPKIMPSFPRHTHTVGTSAVIRQDQSSQHANAAKPCPLSGLKWVYKDSLLPKVKGFSRIRASSSENSNAKLGAPPKSSTGVPVRKFDGVEPFRGKAGSISFYGLTYNSVEESKLVSSPFQRGGGSVLWVLAPLSLILSFTLPPLFISDAVNVLIKDGILAEIVAPLSCEAVFYAGIVAFVLITDWVQKPYLEFSTKRWGLITGLKGHLTTLFFSMGLKVVAPVIITIATWPILGMQAFTAVAPLLFGFLAQFALESFVDKRESSCWPVVPIIFEVYRLYQLTKAAQFVEKLMFVVQGAPNTPQVVARSSALVAMLATFQAVGVVCLWSLLTFLLRLFPSRPVSQKY